MQPQGDIMQAIPNVRPISDFRNHQDELLKEADEAPVTLAIRGRPRVVMVNVKQWNHTARELRDMRAVFHLLETELKDEPNKYTLHELIGLVQARRAIRETTEWTSGADLREMAAAAHG